MGKHVKRNNIPSRRAGETAARDEWEAGDSTVEFDFLSVIDDLTGGEGFSLEADTSFLDEPAAAPESAAPAVSAAVEVPATEADETPKPAKAAPRPAQARGNKKKAAAPVGKKRSSRKKSRRFRRGVIIYLSILLVLIVAVLAVEWVYLDRSQKEMDAQAAALAAEQQAQAEQQAYERAVHRAPQQAFEQWLSGTDADYWTDLWYASANESLDGRDRVREYMAERFGGADTAAFKSLDYTDAAPVYVLKNGEDTLARITLTGSELNWSVSDVALLIEGDQSASVRVASGSVVYCNGTVLGPEYVVTSDSYFTYEPLRESLVNPVSWDTYEVSGLLLPPELTADPPTGGIVTETAEGDFLLCLSDEAGQTYKERSTAFVRAYLFYYMSGYNGTWGNLWSALAYLTPGYQAYQDLYDTYDGIVWNTAYGNIDTSKTTAGDVVIWADNCYSVDVTYDADCTLNGQAIDYADATMRIYFLKTDAGFIISNFETL